MDDRHWLNKCCAELWPHIYLRKGQAQSFLYYTPMWFNILLVVGSSGMAWLCHVKGW